MEFTKMHLKAFFETSKIKCWTVENWICSKWNVHNNLVRVIVLQFLLWPFIMKKSLVRTPTLHYHPTCKPKLPRVAIRVGIQPGVSELRQLQGNLFRQEGELTGGKCSSQSRVLFSLQQYLTMCTNTILMFQRLNSFFALPPLLPPWFAL